MSEEKGRYDAGEKPSREAMLAAERLKQFCKQFDKLNNTDKQACIKRVDIVIPELLAEVYNALNEYMR